MKKDEGLFNTSNFVQIFSNSAFSFMYHHSLPGIVQNLADQADIQFVIKYSFIISGSVLIIIPITAVFAFGKFLTLDKDGKVYPKGKLKYYNLDFMNKIPFIYFITSFYIFLNIAAFSVYIIVIRTNILHILTPKHDAKKLTRIFISYYSINSNNFLNNSRFDYRFKLAPSIINPNSTRFHRRNIRNIYFIYSSFYLSLSS
jgi:hypothetical protein